MSPSSTICPLLPQTGNSLESLCHRDDCVTGCKKGLGRPELRSIMSTAVLTGAEFEWLQSHPREPVPEHVRKEYNQTLAWQSRSQSAKRAVATKRKKYIKWPGGRKKSVRARGGAAGTTVNLEAQKIWPLTAYYEKCDDHEGPYRWWVNKDPGDWFDIINEVALQERIRACQTLGIRVVDHLPGFCSDPECTDHEVHPVLKSGR